MRVEFLDVFIEYKMKDTTLQIKNLIESDELQNIKLLRKKMDELEWLNYENQEMTLSESMIVLESMISVLGLIIKKDIFKVERIMEISDSCIFYANLSLDGVLEKTEKYNDNNEIDEIEEINRYIRVVNADFGDYLPGIKFSNWL